MGLTPVGSMSAIGSLITGPLILLRHSTTMRIAITGGTGKLGSVLYDVLSKTHSLTLVRGDITNFHALREAIKASQPNLVINAAAWTDVDGCAREPDKALSINGLGAQNVALAAASANAAVLHISSNE